MNTAPAPRRIAIIGVSGSGKSTLAAQVAKILRFPQLELDAVFHQPDWGELDTQTFREEVQRFIRQHPRWVIEGNYRRVQATVFRAADTIVWLDPDRRAYLPALVGRTLKRAVTKERLWNDNTESLRDVVSTDPDRSIIAWSVTQQPVFRRRYASMMRDPRWRHATWIRLRTRDEVAWWLHTLRFHAP